MRALTLGGAKELLPVAGVPILHRVVAECVASGVTDVLVVTAPDKEDIPASFLSPAGGAWGSVHFGFAVQETPRGLADAIRLGRDFAEGRPFAVALPDNLFLGERPALAEVIETHRRHGASAVAVVEIDAAEAARRNFEGPLEGREEEDGDFRISKIPDKVARAPGRSEENRGEGAGSERGVLTSVGRYVFDPEVFRVIDEIERELPPGSELDDVPVMQRLLARGRLVGRRLRGRFFDAGRPPGYAAAEAAFARARSG
jgi:UTP-glucose-1-phosphate uridylyltransferase